MCVMGDHGVAQKASPAPQARAGTGGLAEKLGTECFHWQGTSRVAGVDLVGVVTVVCFGFHFAAAFASWSASQPTRGYLPASHRLLPLV